MQESKYTKISQQQNIILGSIPMLLKIKLRQLFRTFFIKQFITAIESIRFEIYLSFEFKYTEFFTSYRGYG